MPLRTANRTAWTMARTVHKVADRPTTASRKPAQWRHASTSASADRWSALPSPQLSPAARRPLRNLMAASALCQCIRYPALRARDNEADGCPAAPRRLVTSCFLYRPPEAARRFGTCSRKCAAGAAAQAPLGPNARPATVCSARSLGWPGSGSTTPNGAWFSHPAHRRFPFRQRPRSRELEELSAVTGL